MAGGELTQQQEDALAARLVARSQSGDSAAFAEIYELYFGRVFNYLRLVLRSTHEAEDAAQSVFLKIFRALPGYEQRSRPFRAWLFTVVRNHALNVLEKSSRVEPEDPIAIEARNGETVQAPELPTALSWVSDQDLIILMGRLPIAQRQVLGLTYMLDLPDEQIAAIVGRTPGRVRTLRHEALRFLERRLTHLGRAPRKTDRARAWRYPRQSKVLRSRRWILG